jgi:hypothetical protein
LVAYPKKKKTNLKERQRGPRAAGSVQIIIIIYFLKVIALSLLFARHGIVWGGASPSGVPQGGSVCGARRGPARDASGPGATRGPPRLARRLFGPCGGRRLERRCRSPAPGQLLFAALAVLRTRVLGACGAASCLSLPDRRTNLSASWVAGPPRCCAALGCARALAGPDGQGRRPNLPRVPPRPRRRAQR